MKSRRLGVIIILISVAVIGLMLQFKVQFDNQQLKLCTETCSGTATGATASCTLDSCPYHSTGNLGWIPILASILAASLGGIGGYLSLTKEEKIIHRREYDLSGLDEEEKKAFEFVRGKPEGLYQSQIVEMLPASKVRVTRILDKLEQRELVERKRRGLSNVVVLKR